MKHARAFREHVQAWSALWDQGRMEVEGDLALKKAVWFSQYYIYSNLPPVLTASRQPSINSAAGIGRTGLSKGANNSDYQGHTLWDNEMYVLPSVIALHPDVAKHVLKIRAAQAGSARQNAASEGDRGMRFPWESAVTGRDVTPTQRQEYWKQQIHVSGAVSWAIQQYMLATRDK